MIFRKFVPDNILSVLDKIDSVVVHSGGFHLDEVTAVSLLKLCGWNGELIRSRDEDVLIGGTMLIDVGMEHDPARLRFDHHQIKGGTVSSAGLIWQWLELDLQTHIFKKISNFILAVDAHDCGVKQMGGYSIAAVVGALNSSNQNGKEQNDNFLFAVEMVSRYISGVAKQELQIIEAADKIKAARRLETLSGEKAIYFDEYCNGWTEYINGDASGELLTITRVIWFDDYQNVYKVQVPALKRGAFDLNGPKIKPCDDAVFVHNGGFIAVFKTLDDVLKYT